ncbi:MAG: hypothetical protein R3234_08930, partial [Thermoanaerobaculia bacterium]|nr:hypothetical protein [Thermoanaerobaculia bacterium]
MSLRRPGPLLAVVLLAVPATVLAFQFRDYAVDDFFITYRYAANLAAGKGLVFNPGERVFGTTAAGHALILAAVRLLTGAAMTRIGTAVTLVAKLALVLLLYLEARRRDRGPEALVGGILLVSHPFAWLHNGAEVHLVLVLLTTGAVLSEHRSGIAGALAGYAGWCRPDAVLGLGFLGLQQWIRRRRIPWRYGLVAAGVLATGLAGAYLWFGSPLPNTLAAKRAQAAAFPGVFPSGADFWAAIAENLVNLYGVVLVPLVLLALAGLPFLLQRGGPALRLLTLYGLGLAIAYPVLRVPPYTWYVVPMFTVGVYSACFAVGAAGRGTWRFFGR